MADGIPDRIYTTRVRTHNGRDVPDLVSAAQRKRAAEIELMLDLQRELLQGSRVGPGVPDHAVSMSVVPD